MKYFKLKPLCASALALSAASLLGFSDSVQAQPTAAPAAPTLPAGHVIAIYNSSGTYTDISGVNDFESWGGWNGAGFFTAGSSQILSYFGVSYGGIGAFETNPQDVAGCTNLFMNVYTPNGDSFAIRIVDTSGHQADITFTSSSGVITDNTWLSLNFPLSQFTAVTPALNLGSIQQIGLICNNPGEDPGSDYYIDNIFFSASTNIVPPPPIPTPTNAAAIPTWPADSVVAMYNSSGIYIDVPVDDWDAGWSSAIESLYSITNTGPTVLQYNSLQYAGVEFYSPEQIDVSTCNTMHVDVWTPNANQFGIQLVSLDNGGTQAAQVNYAPASGTIVSNKWIGLDIPLSSFTAANNSLDLTALQQLLWIDNLAGGGVIGGIFYIDNVYFYSNAVASSPTGTNIVLDPGFEIAAANAIGAANWNIAADSGANILATNQYGGSVNPHSGSKMLYIESTTPATGPVTPPNTDIRSDFLPVTAGSTYKVSFWAQNPVENGGANPQWTVFYYNAANAPVGAPQFTSFASVGATWTQVTGTITPPAGATQMTIGWIQAMGAGNGWDWVTLIDDVSITSNTVLPQPVNVASAVVSGGFQLSFPTQNGYTYTIQYTTNLTSGVWQTLSAVSGNGSTQTASDPIGRGSRFYRVSIQ